MFVCVKLSVLSNALLCALPKQPADKPTAASDGELRVTLPLLAVSFLNLHIYNPSCAAYKEVKIPTVLPCTLSAPHSYFHTFIHPVIFYGAHKGLFALRHGADCSLHGRKKNYFNKAKGQQSPNQSTHSWGAVCYTGTAAEGKGHASAVKQNTTTSLSVLYRQTHNAVYYITCFILLRTYCFADVGKIVRGDLHSEKNLI